MKPPSAKTPAWVSIPQAGLDILKAAFHGKKAGRLVAMFQSRKQD